MTKTLPDAKLPFTPEAYQNVQFGVISNPLSRRNRRDPSIVTRLSALLREGDELASPTHFEALRQKLADWRSRQVQVVVIHGGDGTAHRVITAMVHLWGAGSMPEIALLPAGTMDIAARSLGIRGPAIQALSQLIALDDSAPRLSCSVLRVSGGEHDQYGFLFGNAIIARFLEVQNEAGHASPALSAWILARGSLSAMVGGAYAARLTRPFIGRVTVDGTLWPAERWTAVAAGTVAQMGLGFQPFPSVRDATGHFHAVGISSSVPRLALDLPRIYVGKSPIQLGNHSVPTQEMCIESESAQSFMIDGDFHTAGPTVTVSVGPTLQIRYA